MMLFHNNGSRAIPRELRAIPRVMRAVPPLLFSPLLFSPLLFLSLSPLFSLPDALARALRALAGRFKLGESSSE